MALAASTAATAVQAQPVGGVVARGSGTITQTPTGTVVTQTSEKALYLWNQFSIPQGYSLRINEPNAAAIAFNRVLGGGPSSIMGMIYANGQFWLINSAGIVVGSGASITAAGVLLSTADMSDDAFMSAGETYAFTIPGAVGAQIVNFGRIVASGGPAILAADRVGNAGTITSTGGAVVLAGARTYEVDFAGDGLLNFAVTGVVDGISGAGPLVDNAGTLAAPGGTVLLTAAAVKGVLDNVINTSGIVEATSVANVDGKIMLLASGGGAEVSGTLDASGKGAGQTGGDVGVTGDTVTLVAGSTIDVSGNAGGGNASIGGDAHGAGPLSNAQATTVSSGSIIDADAIAAGNGGQIVVWSENSTVVGGTLTARGGASGGNGGSVETSGHDLSILPATIVNVGASAGAPGQWLLDPDTITVDYTLAGEIDSALASGNVELETTATGTASTVGIPAPDLTSAGTGDIVVDSPITWASSSVLTLSAYRNIDINAPISTAAGGGIALAVDNASTGAGSIVLGEGGSVSAPLGSMTVQVGSTLYTPVGFAGSNDIQTNLIAQFPTNLFLTQNASTTPFVISGTANTCGYTGDGACNFYDGFGATGSGSSITLDVNVADATSVMTLVNAYHPPSGVELASITFNGSGGASVTYPYVGGTDIRDFFQGGYADSLSNTIPNVTSQNAFTVSGVQGAAGTGNVTTGSYGTYNIDEQSFALPAAFANQTLTSIVFTDQSNSAVPILLGVTVATTTAAVGGASPMSPTSPSSQPSQAAQSLLTTQQSSTPPAANSTPTASSTPSNPEQVPPPASQPVTVDNQGSTGGSDTFIFADLDPGAALFNVIAPGTGTSAGGGDEAIETIAPWTTAPQAEPVQSADDPLGGIGSGLFVARSTRVWHAAVPGLGLPASASGNRSLWFQTGPG